ncbi:MAG: UDP-N-acetylmuramoyl-L-alanine--D-glutamate ligase [Symbiobacterium sp.]|uniref:UDP-N-acetylmuramoyl-L-alanine--D-glutamate ligase n=1 Tax=Symbiobacterium sp. TaxID=1971213 RepID=UPI00346430B8
MELQRRAAVVGIGVSNLALIRYLVHKGVSVTACDRRSAAELGERAAELHRLGVRLVTGEGYLAPLADHDLIFLTPGMPKHLPEIEAARRRGAVISGEIGLVLDLCRAPVIGVTGSAGKTTTTTLIGEILRASAREIHVGGNIGTPLIEKVEAIPPEAVVVLELSSFQLQLVRRSPHIAVITNISPNHLDVHATMEEYVEAKKGIFRCQSPADWLVLNADDPLVRSFADEARSRVVLFSRRGDPGGRDAAFIRDGQLVWRRGGQELPTLLVEELRLPGLHNQENVLAAMAACYLAGAPLSAVREVLTRFTGVEHRIEPVRVLDGVKWYNDSKATSPTEAVAALSTLPAPIVLIAGGSDKGIRFDPIAPLVKEKVKCLILTGPTAPKIEEAVRRGGYTGPVHRAADMAEAVALARAAAVSGDTVLLSPACASFDAYRNFEERGRHFKSLVEALQ